MFFEYYRDSFVYFDISGQLQKNKRIGDCFPNFTTEVSRNRSIKLQPRLHPEKELYVILELIQVFAEL